MPQQKVLHREVRTLARVYHGHKLIACEACQAAYPSVRVAVVKNQSQRADLI